MDSGNAEKDCLKIQQLAIGKWQLVQLKPALAFLCNPGSAKPKDKKALAANQRE
jgi:hypothetical protein